MDDKRNLSKLLRLVSNSYERLRFVARFEIVLDECLRLRQWYEFEYKPKLKEVAA